MSKVGGEGSEKPTVEPGGSNEGGRWAGSEVESEGRGRNA